MWKSRDTWSYKQVWLWSTKWSRAKANSSVKRIHWSQQTPFSNNTIDNSTNGQYWNQIDYILCSQRWRGSIQAAKISPGADCGSDHQLCIANFRLKLKKVGKTTRPFRYDLNSLWFYMKITNRFKELDLVDRVPEELWTEVHDIVQEAVIKTIPKNHDTKRQNDCPRRLYK